MDTKQPQRPCKSATASNKTRRNYKQIRINTQRIREVLMNRGYEHLDAINDLEAGTSVRIPTKNKSSKNRSVQISMFSDGLGAYVTDYVTGEKGPIWPNYKLNRVTTFTKERRQEFEASRQKQATEQIRTSESAARIAKKRYRAGVNADSHEYLSKKQLDSSYNAVFEPKTGALLIPMWISGVGLVNLQQIFSSGKKRFLKGARLKRAYSVIGDLRNAKRVLICEGWATGASLFELYGYPVIIAFNAGNLMPVGEDLRSRYVKQNIVIAGDDDRLNAINIGRKKTIEAAEAIGADVAFPELCQSCMCTDWNDYAVCKKRRSNG